MDPMGYVVFFFCIEFWLESLTWCFFGSMIYCTCFFLAMRFGLVSCDFCQPRVMLCLYMYVLTEGFDLVVFFCHTDDVNDLMIQPASPQSMNRFSSSTGWNSWSAEQLPQKGSKLMLVKGCWVVSTESASPQNIEIWNLCEILPLVQGVKVIKSLCSPSKPTAVVYTEEGPFLGLGRQNGEVKF